MNKLVYFLLPFLFFSCACEPEQIARFAFQGMEAMLGNGFLPSEEIRALGNFQGVNVGFHQSSMDGKRILLKLENGDPVLLAGPREILARKCAELYLRDFENSGNYEQIVIQFIQSDPQNPENIALEEYIFQIADFNLSEN
jgi:hypothetical protein